MLEPIVAFFDKLIENFSWKRLSFLLVLLALAVVALWAYESYTSAFKLARIERQIALLEKLGDLSAQPAMKSQLLLSHANTNLQRQLAGTTSTSDIEYELLPWGKKVLAAATAWVALTLIILLSPSSHSASNYGSGNILVGVIALASPFLALSAAIPTFDAWWINYLAYPIGQIAVALLAILLWQRMKRRQFLAAIQRMNTAGAHSPPDA
jgi:hypothetical protein